jgi:hypothetical protein
MTSSPHSSSASKPLSQIQRNRKIARLWALSHELGIDEDNLYTIIEMTTGLNSIRKCTLQQILQVISVLEMQKKAQKKPRSKSKAGVTYLPSHKQRSLARQIIQDISKTKNIKSPDGYLDGVCRKQCGKPFNRVNAEELQSVIEALKAIRARQK